MVLFVSIRRNHPDPDNAYLFADLAENMPSIFLSFAFVRAGHFHIWRIESLAGPAEAAGGALGSTRGSKHSSSESHYNSLQQFSSWREDSSLSKVI